MSAEQNQGKRSLKLDKRTKIFIVGALLAAALFLIEAGIAEILIAMDQECRLSIASIRLGPDPYDACASEWQWYLMRAMSRGIPWVLNLESAPLVGWVVMGLVYSLLGGTVAQLFRKQGIIVFLIAQTGLVAALMGLGYFRQFIA